MLSTLAVLKIAWSGCMCVWSRLRSISIWRCTLDWAQTAGKLFGRSGETPYLWQRPRVWMQMVEDVEMAAAVDEQRWHDEVGRAGGGGCLLTYKNCNPLGSWVSAQYGAQQSRMRNSTKRPICLGVSAPLHGNNSKKLRWGVDAQKKTLERTASAHPRPTQQTSVARHPSLNWECLNIQFSSWIWFEVTNSMQNWISNVCI